MKLFSGCLTFFWTQRGLRIVVKLWHLVSLILFFFFVFEIGFGDLLVFRRRLFRTFGTTQACSRLLSQNKKACRLYWAHFSWAYLSLTRPILYTGTEIFKYLATIKKTKINGPYYSINISIVLLFGQQTDLPRSL